MTTGATIPSAVELRPRRRFPWAFVLLSLLVAGVFAFAIGVIVVLQSFRMSSETRALRNTVFAAAPGEWEPTIELGLGRLPVMLAQRGLGLLDLEPEARLGLQSFHRGSVGVYRRRAGARPLEGIDLLVEARERMRRRGWEPVVSVADGEDAVMVFLEPGGGRDGRLTACVMVANSSDLVLVSGEFRIQPLFELVRIAVEEIDADAVLSESGLLDGIKILRNGATIADP